MNLIMRIRRFFRSAVTLPTEEDRAIQALYAGNPEPLIELMASTRTPTFSQLGRKYWSGTGRITICSDIYGPEVKIDGGELVDCSPAYYGLTHETGKRLYEAICTNVRGWHGHTAKHNITLK
jgi:hypothetical protein